MIPKSRATRVAFRRAAWASVAIHAVAGCALVLLVRSLDKPEPRAPGIDTRTADEPQVRISLTDDAPVTLAEPLAPPPNAPPAPAKPPVEPAPAVPSGPFTPNVPRTLPPELIALIRKPGIVAVGPVNPPPVDPNVRHAGGPPAGTPSGTPAPAIHGALQAGQTVVYVLDCSGSMGASGKLDAARAALGATLKQQPATVRFQVICYAGTAKPLLTTDGTALPASGANVRAAVEALAVFEARGLSDHFGAVRAALAFRPDVIVLLTDADDLSAATLKSVLAAAPKAVPVYLGQVTADGVQRPPRELK